MTVHEAIERAEQVCPIPVLWEKLGLPAPLRRTARGWETWVPWRENPSTSRRPSLAVFEKGGKWWWKDMGRVGEAGTGLTFLAKVRGMSPRQVVGEYLEIAGVNRGSDTVGHQWEVSGVRVPVRGFVQRDTVPTEKPSPPRMRKLSRDEVALLVAGRGIRREAWDYLIERGNIRAGTMYDHACWWLLDRGGLIYQARRIDGLDWEEHRIEVGGRERVLAAAKSRNKAKSWPVPIGLPEAREKPVVAVVEGGPDFVALHDLLLSAGLEEKVGVVGILGASHRCLSAASRELGAEAVFRDKAVLLFPHHDEAGKKAGEYWKRELESVTNRVHTVALGTVAKAIGAEQTIKDINDLLPFRDRFAAWRLFGHWEECRAGGDNRVARREPGEITTESDCYKLVTVDIASQAPEQHVLVWHSRRGDAVRTVYENGKLDQESSLVLERVEQSHRSGDRVLLGAISHHGGDHVPCGVPNRWKAYMDLTPLHRSNGVFGVVRARPDTSRRAAVR